MGKSENWPNWGLIERLRDKERDQKLVVLSIIYIIKKFVGFIYLFFTVRVCLYTEFNDNYGNAITK